MASIIVVDDDPLIQVLLREIMTQDQQRVLVAGDGMEGLAMCRKDAVDLVILDILMP